MLPDFHQDQKIEAQDQYGKWYVARVVQVDEEEKELLIHFEGWNARYDEWISCNSFRLRPLSMENKRKIHDKKHKKVGDCVQARWLDGKYYPAVVKVVDNLCGKGTVQFYQDDVEHTVSLQDIRPQKKQDKQSEWAKAQQEAKEREDRHTALARKSRAKKRSSEPGNKDEAQDGMGKKPRLEGGGTAGEVSSLEHSLASQSGSMTPESSAVSPEPSDDPNKSPAAFKRKAYTPLRTQYSLRETVIPIQPLSREQHGNAESPSKITRRISSAEDGEDVLPPQSDGKGDEKPKKRRVTKKDNQEKTRGRRKPSSTKETATKRSSRKSTSEVVPVTGLPIMSAQSFSTAPQDAITMASSFPLQMLPTLTAGPAPLYTPMPQAVTLVSPNQDHLIPDDPPSPSDASTISTECNVSVISDGKDFATSLNDKLSPVSDPKSISLTRFNMEVDLLNNEDSKSVGSPAVVTIDPMAAHSPVGVTASIADCDPNEERPFVEGTKKTAAIISKSSPKRPSLLPLRRRSLSATSQSGAATRIPAVNKVRRKSEGERNVVRRRQQQSVASRSPRKTSLDNADKEMAPKELVIKMDHNEYKCRFPGCGKSFRKESLLQWHYKHYHPGRNLPARLQANTAPTPKMKAPVQKSPSHKPSQTSPPAGPAVVRQQESAIPAPIQAAMSSVIPKLQLEKTKVKKEFVPTAPLIPVFAVITPPSTPLASTPQGSATKEPSSKVSTPMLPAGTPTTPTVTSFDAKKLPGVITSLPNVSGLESVKLPSNVALELLKGSAVRMVAPKPTVVQRVTPTTTISAVTSSPVGISPTNIGAAFKGFPPVTLGPSATNTTTHLGRPVSSMARPSSPKRGVMIRGHPRGEMPRDSRPRGASFTHVSDDSSADDVDVGEEYYPGTDRHPRASRPFGSSSCSYYCSGNKDDVIHCLCGSFEDEGFMIQCEQCLCWQHADCVGIDEEQPPEHYLCCICQSPLALRKNAKYKFDRNWYRDGKLPSVVGGAPFAHSSDVITSHKISSSLDNLSQCLHSLEQLLSVAGQSNHPLLKHWDSGKESAITRKLTERLATMLKDRESVKKAQMDGIDNGERSARTTPINPQRIRGGASSNHGTKQLQLAPLPPKTFSACEEALTHVSDDHVSSDSSINVTSFTPLSLPPLPPHRRKLFDDDSNPSTPRLQDDSSTPPCGEEAEEMDCEQNGLDLLTTVAATCSRLSTPSTISQDKSPKQDLSPLPVADISTPASADAAPIASFNDEFGVEEASVFALTPSTVTSPEIEQPSIATDQSVSIPETPENDSTQEPGNKNSEPVTELIERLASNLDTTAQLLPLVTPSQFAEAFMKVDTSCWNSRMLLLDHVEAMQEKVLAELDKLEEQYKTLPEIHYSPEDSGSKKELIKKMNEWQRLDITYAA